MSTMATEKALDPEIVVSMVKERDGQYPFSELIEALATKGIDASKSRALIWHAVALKRIAFTPDRTAVQLVPEATDNEGKAA